MSCRVQFILFPKFCAKLLKSYQIWYKKCNYWCKKCNKNMWQIAKCYKCDIFYLLREKDFSIRYEYCRRSERKNHSVNFGLERLWCDFTTGLFVEKEFGRASPAGCADEDVHNPSRCPVDKNTSTLLSSYFCIQKTLLSR